MTEPERDTDYETADALLKALESAAPAAGGLTPSAAARKAKISTTDAHRVLAWMVTNQTAHADGNGAWTRYFPGRAR